MIVYKSVTNQNCLSQKSNFQIKILPIYLIFIEKEVGQPMKVVELKIYEIEDLLHQIRHFRRQ